MSRWLYHVLRAEDDHGDPYAPRSLAGEGYVHCSFQPDVLESARRWFPAGGPLRVLRIDPRPLAGLVALVPTPRGPMPHVHGAIPRRAIVERLELEAVPRAPDAILE